MLAKGIGECAQTTPGILSHALAGAVFSQCFLPALISLLKGSLETLS
jgi:hypothetical protein